METVRTTFVAWGTLVSCLQTDVHDHLVLACELLSANNLYFKVVRICLRMLVYMCMCTRYLELSSARRRWLQGDSYHKAPAGQLVKDQKISGDY